MKLSIPIGLMAILFLTTCEQNDNEINRVEILSIDEVGMMHVTISARATAKLNTFYDHKGFCYSLTPGPSINDQVWSVGYNDGHYTSTIDSLLMDTVYYIRAFAQEGNDVVYSQETQIRTLPFTVGHSYGDGIIVHVDESGEHGVIMAHRDLYIKAEYGCMGTGVVQARNSSIGTGFDNSNAILNACFDLSSAVGGCYLYYTYNYTGPWHLPSEGELNAIFEMGALSNQEPPNQDNWYWSSTEVDANQAVAIDMDSGVRFDKIKNEFGKVRPVRYF